MNFAAEEFIHPPSARLREQIGFPVFLGIFEDGEDPDYAHGGHRQSAIFIIAQPEQIAKPNNLPAGEIEPFRPPAAGEADWQP